MQWTLTAGTDLFAFGKTVFNNFNRQILKQLVSLTSLLFPPLISDGLHGCFFKLGVGSIFSLVKQVDLLWNGSLAGSAKLFMTAQAQLLLKPLYPGIEFSILLFQGKNSVILDEQFLI